MDTAFDNSNGGATLDNLNQDIFQKSSVLTDGDLDMDMDIKNTNITSPSIDTLNNIQSYTIDNQKSSEIIDQNRISNVVDVDDDDDYIIDENNRHSQVRNNIAPLNGKASEFNVSDNYFGPESNVDDETATTTTGSPITDDFNEKNDDIEIVANINRPDELVEPHGIHFENVDYLKTVDEVEECDNNKDIDAADHHHQERNVDSEQFENENKMFIIDTMTDLVAESAKLIDAVLPEKFDDPTTTTTTEHTTIEPAQPENVNVPESGEESEDEWNYIKVNQNANENETQEQNIVTHEPSVESQSLCPELENDNNQTQDDEIVGIEESSLSEADMASQLNPDAKEFVPTSPSPTNTTPINDFDLTGVTASMATLRIKLEDDLVSQSPRKGTENAMVDVPVPEENDFLNDITQRPADLDSTVMSDVRPGSSSSQCSYQEMNLKEAMHGDEKQEYATDALSTPDPIAFEMNSTNGDHEEFINILNKSMRNQDVMNASFYNDGTSDSNNPFKVDLNAVHRLPTSDDENDDERENQAPTTGTTYSFEDTEFGMTEPAVGQSELNGSSAEIGNGESESKSNENDSIAEAVQEMISENMAVLNECNLEPSEAVITTENIASATTENIIDFVENVEANMEQPSVEQAMDLISVEAENPTSPIAVEEPVAFNTISDQCLIPELQPNVPVADSETISVTQNANGTDVAIVAETDTIAETVAVAGVAAVATVAAVAAAAAATKTKSTKPAEPKTKTAPAKKPLSAGVTAKPKATATATATKTAPVPRPRTVATQPPVKTIEKKPTSTLADKKPTSTLTARKPLNGEVKSTTTTTSSVTAAKRPVSSTTTVKSTARTAASSSTTTATRVTASRLTSKPSATAEAPKRVATTKTTTTTTSSTLKPRPASSTLTKSPASKSNTSATDKTAKDTINKLQTSGARAPVSPRSATTITSTRTGTLPLKKADAAKAPSAPAPIKRPTSSTTRPPVSTTTTTTTANKLAPTQKRPITSSTNRATTLETVKKTSTLKKDTKAPANNVVAPNDTKPKENGANGANGTNGTHDAFDMPIELNNDAVNVEQEPVMM